MFFPTSHPPLSQGSKAGHPPLLAGLKPPSNPWKLVSKGLLKFTPTACHSHLSESLRRDGLAPRSWILCSPSVHPKSRFKCLIWWHKSPLHVTARKSICWWILPCDRSSRIKAPAHSPGSPSDNYYCCNKFSSKTNRHAVNLLVWALGVT